MTEDNVDLSRLVDTRTPLYYVEQWERIFALCVMFNTLSDEALATIKVIKDCPEEIKGTRGEITLGCLEEYLHRVLGWQWQTIWNTLEELKAFGQMLSFGELKSIWRQLEVGTVEDLEKEICDYCST